MSKSFGVGLGLSFIHVSNLYLKSKFCDIHERIKARNKMSAESYEVVEIEEDGSYFEQEVSLF